jgi:hypothetical protein
MNRTFIARLIATAAVFVSPIAASATATGTSQQPAGASASASPAAPAKGATTGEKTICKQLPSSSSRLPQRVCLTEKQWKQVDEDSQ